VKPKRAPGLAAVKHAQQQARSAPAREQAVSPCPVDCGWPEDMKQELFGCRTVADHRAWAEKWADYLNGEAARRKMAAVKPVRPAPCGLCARDTGPDFR
jgi:hypothetical protein